MTSIDRKRVLRFERLEPKAAPCSLMLLLSSTAEDYSHVELVDSQYGASAEHVSSGWTYEHTTEQILRFIRSNTSQQEDRAITQPTDAQSSAADQMMKLDDIELRSLIVFAGMDS